MAFERKVKSMAKKKGFTKMDNGFLEAIYQKDIDLTRADMCVLLCIYRHTIGYHKSECMITGVELARLTGFSRREIINVTGRLKARGFIEVTKINGVNRYRIDGVEAVESVKYSSQNMGSTVHTESEPQFTGDVNHSSPESVKYSAHHTIYKEKERNVCKESGTHTPAFFSALWDEYPQKIGKGKLTDEDYAALDRYSYSELHRAIERYKRDKEANGIDYWQNGSTFFKTGYIDYLDENYSGEPLEEETRKKHKGRVEI